MSKGSRLPRRQDGFIIRAASLTGAREQFVPAHLMRSTRSARGARAIAHAMEALEPRQLLTRLVGIDVSEHNGSINWTTVKNTGGKNFAFIRATYGKTSDDLTFLDNVNASTGAVAKGLYAGFYHYAYYDLDSTHTATV